MLPAYRMAQKLHAALVTEISAMQQRIIMNALLTKEFGDQALPTEEALHGYNDALVRAPEMLQRSTERARARIAECVATVREIEAMFKEHESADLKAFAKAMAERMRKTQ